MPLPIPTSIRTASLCSQTYLYLGVASVDELLRRIHAEVTSNPPLGYELEEAAHLFFQTAKDEVAASREEVGGGG